LFASGMLEPEVSWTIPDWAMVAPCSKASGLAEIATNATSKKAILLVIVLAPFNLANWLHCHESSRTDFWRGHGFRSRPFCLHQEALSVIPVIDCRYFCSDP